MQRLLPFLLAVFALWGTSAAAQEGGHGAADGAARATAFHADAALPRGLAQFGPFTVLDEGRAAMAGVSDTATPAQFAAMLRAFPQIALLEMVECPGTDDDVANLALGRMIRERGIATHVPSGGSVRSGAVELFLAGIARTMDQDAEFAVHSWQDDLGREADDYAEHAPIHREYLSYYRDMGFSETDAQAFYDMTNSVPHDQALWLTAQDMGAWIGRGEGAPGDTVSVAAPRLAYLDFGSATF